MSQFDNNTINIKKILEVANNYPANNIGEETRAKCQCVSSYVNIAQKLQKDKFNISMSSNKTLNEIRLYHTERKNTGNIKERKAHALIIEMVKKILCILLESEYFKQKLIY